ncbi:MAG TPA: hypothetical protein VMT53_15655 [Terriglobales bacterium]|nr:hypothetical protein [Terriglobales bacterium]
MANAADVQLLLLCLRAIEQFHFRNVALETLLQIHQVQDWQNQADKLATDNNVQPEVRVRFQQLYAGLEHDLDLSVVEAMLKLLPPQNRAAELRSWRAASLLIGSPYFGQQHGI